MEKKMASLLLKQIRPTSRSSYEVDYEIEVPPGSSRITGELIVRVQFHHHGGRKYYFSIEEIKEAAQKEIRELLPNLIKQLTPE